MNPDPLPIDHPDLIRVVSNPLRIAIYNYLYEEGGGTATTCGQAVHITPSAASYHLRVMAKHQLIESFTKGEDGRETWWRLAAEGFRLVAPSDDEGGRLVSRMRLSLLQEAVDRVRRFFAKQQEYPHAWQLEAGANYFTRYMTAEEVRQLRERLDALVAEVAQLTPEERPVDARPVSIILSVTPIVRGDDSAA